MPFIIPRKRKTMRRNGKALFNRYETLDDTIDFLLQARRRPYTKKKAIRNYRIVTKKTPLFEIAYSSDLGQLRAREWNYVRIDLPQIMPSYLEVGSKARRTWLVAHFTQVAVAVDGATETLMDDFDSGDEGGGLSSEEEISGARAIAKAYQMDQETIHKHIILHGGAAVQGMSSASVTHDSKHPANAIDGALSSAGSDGPFQMGGSVRGGGGGANSVRESVGPTSLTATAAAINDELFEHRQDEMNALRQSHLLAREASSTLRRSSAEFIDENDEWRKVAPVKLTQSQLQGELDSGLYVIGEKSWYLVIAAINALSFFSRFVTWDMYVGLIVLVNTVCVMNYLKAKRKKAKRLASAKQVSNKKSAAANAKPPPVPLTTQRLSSSPEETVENVVAAAPDETKSHIAKDPADAKNNFSTSQESSEDSEDENGSAAPRQDEPLFESIDPTSFNVRVGPDYRKYKKKAPSGTAFFNVEGFHCFKTPAKVEHIEKYLKREKVEGADGWVCGVPSTFIINVLIPGYPPNNPLWGKTVDDGPGYSWVFICKISDETKADLLAGRMSNALRLLQRFMASEEGDPLRDRFKGIPRLFNVDEVEIGGTGRQLIKSYNAKPLLTRPQHVLYKGEDFAELDVDVHRFAYIARQGADSFRSKVPQMILDCAFVIEGHTDDELPEQLLGCVRVNHCQMENAPSLS